MQFGWRWKGGWSRVDVMRVGLRIERVWSVGVTVWLSVYPLKIVGSMHSDDSHSNEKA